MEAPTTLLFDNDGVLVDTERYFFQATRETLESVGASLPRETFVELSLRQGRGVWHLVPDADEEDKRALRARRDARFLALIRSEPIVLEGVEAALEELASDFRMAVVTSARRVDFEAAHARTGLARFFAHSITLEDAPRSKPHPDPYLAALDAMDVRPDQCLVVEDSERGLHAALAAGIRCAVVPNALTEGQDFSGAALRLGALDELPGRLR